jgi:hypothetical protein
MAEEVASYQLLAKDKEVVSFLLKKMAKEAVWGCDLPGDMGFGKRCYYLTTPRHKRIIESRLDYFGSKIFWHGNPPTSR